MKLENYKEQRVGLVMEAEELINESKFEDAAVKMAAVTELDNKYEAVQVQLANLNALKEQELVSLENKSIAEGALSNMTKVEVAEVKLSNEVLLENAFAKTVMGQELTNIEMQNVTYAEDNQVVIPQHTMEEIIGLVSEQYPFFGDARKMAYNGTLTLPKHKAIISGDAKFYGEKEATAVEENEFVEVRLTGKEVAKLIEVSFKVEAMSITAFMNYLKQELVDRIGAVVGSKVFTGNGTTEFEGAIAPLKTAGQVVEYDATAGLKYGDLTSALGKVASQYANGSAIYANNATVWNNLANIMSVDGKPLFIADVTAGGVGRLFGQAVKVDGGVPDGVIVIGNANKGYVVNTVKGITIETDKDLKARTTQFLGHAIMDGAVTAEKALVVLAPKA